MDRINLHEILKKGTYDHGIICTYTFDAEFFEDYCLERLSAVAKTPSLTVLVDEGTYEEVITSEGAHRPKLANLRYLLCPVRASACFHSKLILLVGKRRSCLVIGSANFTRPGLTSNGETAALLERGDEDPDSAFGSIFAQAFQYLRGLSEQTGNQSLQSNLEALARDAEWIQEEWQPDPQIQLVHNLSTPIWDQITDAVSHTVTQVDVVSPFFDKDQELLRRVIRDLSPKVVRVLTENGNTTLRPEWLATPEFHDGRLQVQTIRITDQDRLQPLHAKLLLLRGLEKASIFFGSANFTRPALLKTIASGNAEIGLLIRNIETSDDLGVLLDPSGNAKSILSPEELTSGRPDEPVITPSENRGIRLLEATTAEDHIRIRAHMRPELECNALQGDLKLPESRAATGSLEKISDEIWRLPVSPDLGRRMEEGSTVLLLRGLRGPEQVAESNPLLVTNLREFKSGQNLRRSRHIREAQESANQFFRVLNELLEAGEEAALLTFLNFCDIPILEASRPPSIHHDRPSWFGDPGMRALGKKNLRIYRELHAASMAFFERHLKKLQTHVKNGSLGGVSNYFHIFYGIGGILRAQVERVLLGLEATDSAMSADAWYSVRHHLDEYYEGFRKINTCLYDGYLPRLLAEYGKEKVGDQFCEELEALDDLRSEMFAYRPRLARLVASSLKIKTSLFTLVEPPWGKCLFRETRWSEFRDGLDSRAQDAERFFS